MATGFLHLRNPGSWPAMFDPQSCELYMAVLAIEWRINQRLERPDTTNWDQVMDPFSKVCMIFVYFCEIYIHRMFWP